jgi:NCS2 family nucleobase:cation symporter-2
VLGTLISLPFGLADFSGVAEQDWFGVSTPFHFGLPTFEVSAIVAMCVVALVIMTETTGDMLAIGEIVDKPVAPRQLADGLRADGLSTLLGGVFNTFPYTAFAQNVGLVSLTGVRSRYVATFAGAVLVVLGLLPKLGGIVQGIPQGVLGGAGVALFGMVAASGVRTLSRVRFNNANVLVVAISLGIGLLPTVSPDLYAQFPTWFQIIFNSGISAGAITAIVLNLVFNSRAVQRSRGTDEGEFSAHDAVRAAATGAVMPVRDSAATLEGDRSRSEKR